MKERLHGMDALRGIAMWLGVVLHSIIVYQVNPRAGWPVDEGSSKFFDFLYNYLHAFRMPLFFVVAGFFAHFLIEKKGIREFLKHRRNRILYPFLLSILTIVPLSSFPFHIYWITEGNIEWGIIPRALRDVMNWTGLYHIWFLYYLLFFYVFMIIGRTLPIGAYLPGFRKDYQFLSMTVLLVAIQYFMFNGQVEAWTGIVPKIPQLCYYGFFFWLGYLVYNNINFLYLSAKPRKIYFLLGMVLVLIITYIDVGSYLVFSVSISLATLFLILGHIMLFMTVFNKESKFLRFVSDSSYWFYLIHLPIVVAFQLLLLNVDIFIGVKALFIILVATSISLLSYKYFVRNTVIGVLLNGKKMK